ncbi:hypothetical protein CAI21_22655, partial [Alkalilimnicola ehrlichii]|uniref:hypothetical protein n=1 Tax=Alkalilimnicola ehrlichii TaxID=351052 RepID=UPI000E38F3E6
MLRRLKKLGLHGPLPRDAALVYSGAPWYGHINAERAVLVQPTGSATLYFGMSGLGFFIAFIFGSGLVMGLYIEGASSLFITGPFALLGLAGLIAGLVLARRYVRARDALYAAWDGKPDLAAGYFDRRAGKLVLPKEGREYPFAELQAYIIRHPTRHGLMLHDLVL